MLYRVSGKLSDGRPFGARIEATDAVQAWTKAVEKLTAAKIKTSDIAEYRVRKMDAVATVTIGKAKSK